MGEKWIHISSHVKRFVMGLVIFVFFFLLGAGRQTVYAGQIQGLHVTREATSKTTIYTNWQEAAAALGDAARPAGEGTAENPYQIADAKQFAWFAYQVDVNKSFNICGVLTADIDLMGSEFGGTADAPLPWVEIGTHRNLCSYQGNFDGQGHKIEHLYISQMNLPPAASSDEWRFIGLFGVVSGATIRNFVLMNPQIEASGGTELWLGAAVGEFCGGSNVIEQVGVVGGSIHGNGTTWVAAGGIAGNMENGTLTMNHCFSTATVEAESTISNCLASGLISVKLSEASVSNSYFAGTITSIGPGHDVRGLGAVTLRTENINPTIDNVYYDSTLLTPVGDKARGTGKTTSELKAVSMVGTLNQDAAGTFFYPSDGITNSGYPVLWNDYVMLTFDGGAQTLTAGADGFEYSADGRYAYTKTKRDGTLSAFPTVTASTVKENYQMGWKAGETAAVKNVTKFTGNTLLNADWVAANWQAVGEQLPTSAQPAGSGDSGSPYQISSAEQLAWFMNEVNAKQRYDIWAILNADIDLLGREYGGSAETPFPWVAIGPQRYGEKKSYIGSFDGQGHQLNNLYIKKENVSGDFQFQGLFGCVGSVYEDRVPVTIKNLILLNPRIDVSGSTELWIGPLVGETKGEVTIEHVGVIGGTIHAANTGEIFCVASGIIGNHKRNEGNSGVSGDISMKNCFSTADVSTQTDSQTYNYVSGLLSVAEGGSIENCYYGGKLGEGSVTGAVTLRLTGITNTRATNVYYDQEKVSVVTQNTLGEGMPTAKLKTRAVTLLNGGLAASNRIFYRDAKNSNGGYPVFDPCGYENWQQLGAEVLDYDSAVTGDAALLNGPAGDGSEADPYRITSAEQLAWFMNYINTAEDNPETADVNEAIQIRKSEMVLEKDIDLTGARYGGTTALPLQWVPIGLTREAPYKGNFDGKGHVISHLYISVGRPKAGITFLGLFGQVSREESEGTLKNVTIDHPRISADAEEKGELWAAPLVGETRGQIVVEHVGVIGGNVSMSGGNTWCFAGGLISNHQGGGVAKMKHCFSTADVYAQSNNSVASNPGKTQSSGLISFYYRNCQVTDSYYGGKATVDADDSYRSIGAVCYRDTVYIPTIENVYYDQENTTPFGFGMGTGRTNAQMTSPSFPVQLNRDPEGTVFYPDNPTKDSGLNAGYPVFSDTFVTTTFQISDGSFEATDPLYEYGNDENTHYAYIASAKNATLPSLPKAVRDGYTVTWLNVDKQTVDKTTKITKNTLLTGSWKDTQKPSKPDVAKEPAGEWANQDVTLTISNLTDNAGVATVWYSLSADRTNPVQISDYQAGASSAKLVVKNHTIYYIWSVDAAGNQSDTAVAEIKIDRLAPVVEPAVVLPGTSEGSSRSISVVAYDRPAEGGSGSSGIQSVFVTADPNRTKVNTDAGDVMMSQEKNNIWSAILSGTIDSESVLYIIATDTAGNITTGEPVQLTSNWQDIGAKLAQEYWPSGTGTASEPYQIGTAEQLAWYMNQINTVNNRLCAILTADIDLIGEQYGGTAETPIQWVPIGTSRYSDVGVPYAGSFDGRGYSITNLYIRRNHTTINNYKFWNYVGLFGGVGLYNNESDVHIENLRLINPRITISGSTELWAGALIGESKGLVTVRNVAVIGGFVYCTEGNTWAVAGGIIGNHERSGSNGESADILMENCFSTADVKAVGLPRASYASGIISIAYGGTIRGCYSAGTVEGNGYVGAVTTRDRGMTYTTTERIYYNQARLIPVDQDIPSACRGEGKTTAQLKAPSMIGVLNGGVDQQGFYPDHPTAGSNGGYPVLWNDYVVVTLDNNGGTYEPQLDNWEYGEGDTAPYAYFTVANGNRPERYPPMKKTGQLYTWKVKGQKVDPANTVYKENTLIHTTWINVVPTLSKSPETLWHNSDVTLLATGLPDITTKVLYSPNSDKSQGQEMTFTSESGSASAVVSKSGTYYVWIVDDYGNSGDSASIDIRIDRTVPQANDFLRYQDQDALYFRFQVWDAIPQGGTLKNDVSGVEAVYYTEAENITETTDLAEYVASNTPPEAVKGELVSGEENSPVYYSFRTETGTNYRVIVKDQAGNYYSTLAWDSSSRIDVALPARMMYAGIPGQETIFAPEYRLENRAGNEVQVRITRLTHRPNEQFSGGYTLIPSANQPTGLNELPLQLISTGENAFGNFAMDMDQLADTAELGVLTAAGTAGSTGGLTFRAQTYSNLGQTKVEKTGMIHSIQIKFEAYRSIPGTTVNNAY